MEVCTKSCWRWRLLPWCLAGACVLLLPVAPVHRTTLLLF
jgi:hypothetical protein